MDSKYQKILNRFPFLTLAQYNIDRNNNQEEYLGIIGNSDLHITSMYVYNYISDNNLQNLFLKLGDEWWWETNHQIPINVVMQDRWKPFRPYMRSFATKEFKIVAGPSVSLDSVIQKRVRRRFIQLVRNI
jgi:hypothetical protein